LQVLRKIGYTSGFTAGFKNQEQWDAPKLRVRSFSNGKPIPRNIGDPKTFVKPPITVNRKMALHAQWDIPCGYLDEHTIVTGHAAAGVRLAKAFHLAISSSQTIKPPDVPARMTIAEFDEWKTLAQSTGYRITIQDM